MSSALPTYEPFLRGSVFFGVLAAIAIWETMAPRRPRRFSRWRRWPANLSIVAINAALVRFVLPTAAVGVAVLAEQESWGVFNNVTLPAWLEAIVAFVLLDLAIYFQHLMFHAVPAFWRLHRMHHSDPDFDVTTGGRFHPLEILLSMLLKMAVVLVVGPAAIAVMVFEIALNATSMFNHANASLPSGLDRVIRRFVVTPDMHRLHHSPEREETNANFGFNLPWWDRLFGTYRDQPKLGHDAMTIGLADVDGSKATGLGSILVQPFVGAPGRYPIGGQER